MEHKSEEDLKMGHGDRQKRGGEEDDKKTKKKKTNVETLSSPLLSYYFSFRKNLYTEVNTEKMNPEEVVAYRKQLELEIVGEDVPNPIKTWAGAGLPSRVLDTLSELNYVKPMPIQAQAIPVIMSGRDCIGIAENGSGKTVAYILPMLRHLTEPATRIHGALGLIIAPTKEVVQQIEATIKTLAYMVPCLTCVPVYTSGVLEKVSELRTGPGIVVCTPELTQIIGAGEIKTLIRVTYLVLDEADRMIDMGYAPQILGIIRHTRRDRQTLVFSATFPPEVKALAKKLVAKPAVEIHHVVKQDHHAPGGGGDRSQQAATTQQPATGGVAVVRDITTQTQPSPLGLLNCFHLT